MRFSPFQITAVLAFVVSMTSQAGAQEDPVLAAAMDCSQNGQNCKYWEPAGYDAQKKYPLVVYLHGAGSSGTTLLNSDEVGRLFFDPGAVHPKDPVFVMMPQCNCTPSVGAGTPGTQEWVNAPWGDEGVYSIAFPESPASIQVRSQIGALRGKYNIDPDRIYVFGTSMGGLGAWDMIARHPDIFAAGASDSGVAAPDATPMMKNMAAWAFHNVDDSVVPVSGDRTMFAALAKAGSRPTYTEGDSGGHVVGFPSGFVPWLYAQRRGVPATSTPDMQFLPEGGQVSSPVTITLSSSFGGTIHYTTDLSVPSANNGTLYNGPITLSSSAVLIAVATRDGKSVFHAAPIKVGDSPLPVGAELMDGPSTSPQATGGATGNGGSGGSGGAPGNPNMAAGGSGNSTPGSGGSLAQPMPSSGSGAATSTVPPGTVPTGAMPAGQTPKASPRSGSNSSSGCGLASRAPAPGATFGLVWLFGLTAAGFRSWRRARQKATPSHDRARCHRCQ